MSTYFLKLGGSLITDKNTPQKALIPQIDLITRQISRFRLEHPQTTLLIGHGSGSFGHIAAQRFNTRQGVKTDVEWDSFAQVWFAARLLNQIMIERFNQAGLPVISLPISASAVADKGQVKTWNMQPIQSALEHHLLPVIYGDVVIDDSLGGTILSTEEQFSALVSVLHPEKIFLAGLEKGVWEDYPQCTKLIPLITPSNFSALSPKINPSASVDVTGGMASKVSEMFRLIQLFPKLEVHIFSGLTENSIYNEMSGRSTGTLIRAI